MFFSKEVFRVDGEVEREDAVAAMDGLEGVAVDARDAVFSAAPVVGSLALADGDRRVHVVGRVDDQGEVEGAVATVEGLQVEVAFAGGVQGDAFPDVRQLVVADGVALLEVVARVDGDLDSVDIEATEVVGYGVGIESSLGDCQTSPVVGAALAERDGVVVDHAGRVDSEVERVDAVTAVAGG